MKTIKVYDTERSLREIYKITDAFKDRAVLSKRIKAFTDEMENNDEGISVIRMYTPTDKNGEDAINRELERIDNLVESEKCDITETLCNSPAIYAVSFCYMGQKEVEKCLVTFFLETNEIEIRYDIDYKETISAFFEKIKEKLVDVIGEKEEESETPRYYECETGEDGEDKYSAITHTEEYNNLFVFDETKQLIRNIYINDNITVKNTISSLVSFEEVHLDEGENEEFIFYDATYVDKYCACKGEIFETIDKYHQLITEELAGNVEAETPMRNRLISMFISYKGEDAYIEIIPYDYQLLVNIFIAKDDEDLLIDLFTEIKSIVPKCNEIIKREEREYIHDIEDTFDCLTDEEFVLDRYHYYSNPE